LSAIAVVAGSLIAWRLAAAGDSPQLIQAHLQFESLMEYRQQFPALREMRADYFRGI
jgi:hypothetical protein